MIRRRLTIGGLMTLAALASLGVWQKQPMAAWWHVRQLMNSDEASRAACVEAVIVLDEAAVPALLRVLTFADDDACRHVESALVALVKRWGSHDTRAPQLLEQLRDRFAGFSPSGQAAALRSATALLQLTNETETLPASLTQPAGDLLRAAQATPSLRPPMLFLAGALLDRVARGQWLDECRKFTLQGLRDEHASTRAAALHLSSREGLRTDADVMSLAMTLLRDPEVDVRRAAVLVLGSATELVSEDDLLPLLHDPDPEVQQTCELALRGRGLQERQLQLARLISDESPAARLQVLFHLRGSDVEPGIWLRRLSHDPAPAVRAAAVRAAAGQPQIDLSDRLLEITRQDASPTVRELAAFYLARPAPK